MTESLRSLPIPPASADAETRHSVLSGGDLPVGTARSRWQNLHGSALALALTRTASQHDRLLVAFTATTAGAERLLRELKFYAREEIPIRHLPDWETLPYDVFSPHQDIVSERLATLNQLPRMTRGLLVVPMATACRQFTPVPFVESQALKLECGMTFDPATERNRLDAAGYRAVDIVSGRGEYAVRGSLMDIFPMGSAAPVRIDLFDDEIESLRAFDPETQRTIETLDRLELLPAKEFPLTSEAISRFRRGWHERFDHDVRRCSVYQDVSSGLPPGGVEYYLPLFFDELASLFDYLPSDAVAVAVDSLTDAYRQVRTEIDARYDALAHDVTRPLLKPQELWLPEERWFAELKRYPRIAVVANGDDGGVHFASETLPELGAEPRSKQPLARLTRFLTPRVKPTLFVAESAGRREVLDEQLRRAGITTRPVSDFQAFLDAASAAEGPAIGDYQITVGNVDRSALLAEFDVITEFDLYDSKPRDSRTTTRVLDPDQIIRNLTELTVGAPVVHIDHGVGRYQGLTTLEIDGENHEFLTLIYADDAKLYVPVTSLHLIGRYSGSDEKLAPLHRLGTDQWDRAKRKAAERANDAAAELLNLYAQRASRQATPFKAPADDYARFAAQFEFETTDDQERAIQETIADLCSSKPTDRLVCGDVGFGKTEVAMRAAFVAVQSGRQVAVLVPTTLLAQQHYETFRDRFADWPVNIEVISRLRSEADINRVSKRLETGQVDVLIGTHRLLNPALKYSELGLVIIDEEHRFGVRQKERLKALRAEVDILTLTATPIPRTLNLAMTGLRDLSIIATPPARRLSINTFVQQSSPHLVREAIARELARGGQVFYVHNEVKSIDRVANELADAIPEARVGVGHGQMHKPDLARVMNEFTHRQLNVLVCTTIIENGIDVPNANTIIIDRADKFGLAQLHQLRGRVGRSTRQAYAYLLTPPVNAMTADAKKRLEAIEAAGELGVGFTLATHDLEIRGAGELLGEDQSGQIEAVGFSLYMELLERAVAAIREGKTPDVDAPLMPAHQEVNLHAATIIPDDYLPDVHTRLIFYKRISAADAQTLDELKVEMIDRFGPLPEPLGRLFAVTELKQHLARLGIEKLDLHESGGKLEFNADTRIDPRGLIDRVQKQPDVFRFDGGSVLRISRELGDFEQRLAFAEELLSSFTVQSET
ncbi:MAG: transcription-repair coupling factor [Pseudomonadota bacterium]